MSAILANPGRSELAIATAAALAFGVLCLSAALGALASSLLALSPLTPRDSIEGSPDAVASLVVHNAGVAVVPLALLALGWDQLRGIAPLTDALVGAMLIANGAVVGIALERAGSELWAYLPHLPLEWAAIALPAGAWFAFRAEEPESRPRALLRVLAASAVALGAAAVIEAYYAPVGT